MNERIYTLAEQVGAIRWNDELNGNSIDFSPAQLEKFAKLIVSECVKIAFQNDIAKFTRDGYQIGLDIQKYFGVEE